MTASVAIAAESLLRAASWCVWAVGALTCASHLHWAVTSWLDRRDETRLIDHARRAKADLDRPRRVIPARVPSSPLPPPPA